MTIHEFYELTECHPDPLRHLEPPVHDPVQEMRDRLNDRAELRNHILDALFIMALGAIGGVTVGLTIWYYHS